MSKRSHRWPPATPGDQTLGQGPQGKVTGHTQDVKSFHVFAGSSPWWPQMQRRRHFLPQDQQLLEFQQLGPQAHLAEHREVLALLASGPKETQHV